MIKTMKNKVTFKGWKVGMQKIPFTKLLNEKGNLSLREAKSVKDRLVNDDEIITLEFKDEDEAKIIYKESKELGVICELHK